MFILVTIPIIFKHSICELKRDVKKMRLLEVSATDAMFEYDRYGDEDKQYKLECLEPGNGVWKVVSENLKTSVVKKKNLLANSKYSFRIVVNGQIVCELTFSTLLAEQVIPGRP